MGDAQAETRGWKLFVDHDVVSYRPHGTKAVGREELAHRAEEFSRGRWTDLISQAQHHRVVSPRVQPQTDEDDMELRGHAAMAKIQAGQVSRASPRLDGSTLAPRTEETFNLLQGRRPQEQVRPIPEEVLRFRPEQQLKFKKSVFSKCLREAPSGSSPGPGGCSNEVLRVCLEDGELLSLLHFAAQDFARGEVPPEITHLFTLASMTAIRKADGGVRGNRHWDGVSPSGGEVFVPTVHLGG